MAIHFGTMRIWLSTLAIPLLLISCAGVNTSDPRDAFKYWAGQTPPDNIRVLNGKYWQSGHWTREYILFLKLRPTEEWWNEFIARNSLKPAVAIWTKPSDSPDWFRPSATSQVYCLRDDFNNSRYFRDSATGVCYIYEIQL